MSDARTKKERFLPWSWARLGLSLDVLEVRLDGAQPATVDVEHRLVVLVDSEEWVRAQVRVRVAAAEEMLASTLGNDDAAALVLVLRCDETRWRSGVRLAFSRSSPQVETTFELEKRLVAGHVELSAFLVRDADAEQPVPGLAARAHARLAGSRPWEFRVDRPRELSGLYLDVRYRSFTADLSIPEPLRRNLWRLETDADAPILWVNSDHREVVGVLDARGHLGARAALRDLAYDVFAPLVWVQLFLRAATSLRVLGEVGMGWQDSVLDAVARLLFPEQRLTEDAREQLEAALDDLPDLVNRLDSALQAQHDVARHLLRVVEEVS